MLINRRNRKFPYTKNVDLHYSLISNFVTPKGCSVC